MALDKKAFRKKLGVALGDERIIERKQGCWNCQHWDMEKAVDLWWSSARNEFLARATKLAMSETNPLGEKHPSVVAIRQTVPQLDAGMPAGVWGICALAGKGGSEADFAASTYLCGVWTGKLGASIAKAGEKADELPQELVLRDLGNPFTEDN